MYDIRFGYVNDDLNKVKAETASVMAEETRAKREEVIKKIICTKEVIKARKNSPF